MRQDLVSDDLEVICLEIKRVKSKPFFVISWYRPPNNPAEIFDKFEIMLRKLEAEGKEYHIVGDLNCNLLDTEKNVHRPKSTGPDKINARLVKDSAEVICPTLTKIFNSSLQQGIFPEDLKNATISPIYKNGDKSDCSNYRPISVLSNVAKILEKIVYNQLISYINENNILTNRQFSFRKSHSTTTSLLKSTNKWLLNIDKGLINGVLFLDLRKAFDTVDHKILIDKLKLYGITGNTLHWFTSYLDKRYQTCKVNNVRSARKLIECGVPQGSNLGPLLFLLYVNDLPNCLDQAEPSMFADDTNISTSAGSVEKLETQLNIELDKIYRWLVANKLTLNVSKTEYMIIGSCHNLGKIDKDPVIKIGSETVNRVHTSKSLGVIIDDKLKWEDQIDSISKKVSREIGAIKLIKPYVPKKCLTQVYNALVQPYFDYCSLVWQNCKLELQSKLQKLQNRAARIITGDNWEIRSKDVLNKLNWLPLNQRRLTDTLLFMRKIFKDEVPISISNQFQLSVNEQYNLRSNCTMLKLAKRRTNTLKRSFSYHAAKTLNKLPTDLKNLSISEKVFKHNLKDFINENPSFLSNFSSYL